MFYFVKNKKNILLQTLQNTLEIISSLKSKLSCLTYWNEFRLLELLTAHFSFKGHKKTKHIFHIYESLILPKNVVFSKGIDSSDIL